MRTDILLEIVHTIALAYLIFRFLKCLSYRRAQARRWRRVDSLARAQGLIKVGPGQYRYSERNH